MDEPQTAGALADNGERTNADPALTAGDGLTKTNEAVGEQAKVTARDGETAPEENEPATRGGESAPEKAEAEQAEQNGIVKPYKKRKGFRYGCYLFVKRSFDLLASGIFLIIFSWLYLILAICVKCSDGGPVFYSHKRLGKNGKIIYIPKFRSMKKNADKLENMLTPEQLEVYKREYKLDDDPRVTRLGKFLRKTSLDELPNIWAIFTGKISVIGPRPLVENEIKEKYGDDAEKLLSVKPGMIGWWAANGRSNTTYESGERQKLELYYVDHCSVWLDIKIIFKTVIGVFRRTGAK